MSSMDMIIYERVPVMNDTHPRSKDMSKKEYSRKSRLSRLRPGTFTEICGILNMNNDWKKIAASLKHRDGTPKFKDWELWKIETGKDPARSIIQSLIASNISLGSFIELLEKLRLYRAAHFLAVDFLKEPPKDYDTDIHEPNTDTQDNTYRKEYSQDKDDNEDKSKSDQDTVTSGATAEAKSEELSSEVEKDSGSAEDVSVDSDDLLATRIGFHYEPGHPHDFQYNDLAKLTNNFNARPIAEGGNLLGSGGFAQVFYGHSANFLQVAVKRLTQITDISTKQFNTEVEVLSWFNHDNLLALIGFSSDGPHPCIIYPYMKNGSLQDKLACKNDTSPLPTAQRLPIAIGTARGIHQLHKQNPDKALIHRDIKTANILLDKDLVPKVGDFGIAKLGPSLQHEDMTHTHTMASEVIGTRVYMPPEAFDLVISEKYDTYSFGVVLLEILTGLPAFDMKRNPDQRSLISYVDDTCEEESVMTIVDSKGGAWKSDIAEGMHALAEKCLQQKRQKRPLIKEILDGLEELATTADA